MTVTVLGLGYIGLPTALLLAKAGHTVHGFDVNTARVEGLNQKQLPFEEPGLEELFSAAHENFKAETSVQPADVFLIAVPTPQKDKKADLTYVLSALEMIKPVFAAGNTVIVESTIGPIDSRRTIIPLLESWGMPFSYAYCPERAIPGNTLNEMVKNDRVVGGKTAQDAEKVKDLYASFVSGNIFLTDPTTAAVCKLMENTYRDVNIALANEFALLGEELNFNVWEAIELANHHPRVHLHQPGPGVGGHCIAIDPWYFVGESQQTALIKQAREINDAMPQHVSELVKKTAQKLQIAKPIVGLLGYAYKKNVDDARETPAETVARAVEGFSTCLVADPHCLNTRRPLEDLENVLATSDIIVLTTDHDIFESIEFSRYSNILAVIDTRNFFTAQNFAGASVENIVLGTPAK